MITSFEYGPEQRQKYPRPLPAVGQLFGPSATRLIVVGQELVLPLIKRTLVEKYVEPILLFNPDHLGEMSRVNWYMGRQRTG